MLSAIVDKVGNYVLSPLIREDVLDRVKNDIIHFMDRKFQLLPTKVVASLGKRVIYYEWLDPTRHEIIVKKIHDVAFNRKVSGYVDYNSITVLSIS